MAESDRNAAERLLAKLHGETCRVQTIDETAGPQGASGGRIRYFSVTSSGKRNYVDRLVAKSAVRREREVMKLLALQGCAIPPFHAEDAESDGRAVIWMPFLDERPLPAGHILDSFTGSLADGLAKIHVANLGHRPDWLPPTTVESLWLHVWRPQWELNLRDKEFSAEFGQYTARLDASMERLLAQLDFLSREGSSLTLLNVDLTPAHIRLRGNAACFIDWEQSLYGTLYLDLPNAFSTETVLLYRDALASYGIEIAVPEFLERFHEIGRFMGLRYLETALAHWAKGGDERQKARWFLYLTFSLALHGR